MRPPFASRGICQQSQAHRLLTFHRSEAHEGASGALTLAMSKADWRRRVYELRKAQRPTTRLRFGKSRTDYSFWKVHVTLFAREVGQLLRETNWLNYMASAVQADASQEFNAYSSDSEVDSQDALFTEAGRPVRFFLHESLPQKKKESAVQAIEAYGGLITVNHDKAQIILIEEKHLGCSFEILEARYGCHPDEKIRNIEVYRHSQLKTWIDSERFTIRKIR